VSLDNFYALVSSLLQKAEALAKENDSSAPHAVFARQVVLAIVALSPWLASSRKVHARVFGSQDGEGEVSVCVCVLSVCLCACV
jgi:hypothetical protein